MSAPKHFIKLAEEIDSFLSKHAGILPDFDPEFDDPRERFTSPDASIMLYSSDMLKKGELPGYPWSSWSSGGYKPYSDKVAREWHDRLVKQITDIRPC